TQSSSLLEHIHNDAHEITHRDDAQTHQHLEDIPPDDCPPVSIHHTRIKPDVEPTDHPPVGADRIHLESVGEPIAIPPASNLTTVKAEVTEHDPEPPELQPSTLPKPLYSDAHEPVELPIQESHYLMMVTDDNDTHKPHEYTLHRKDEVVNIPKEPDDRPTQHDTTHEVTTTYSPQHDSIAEHVNQILCHIACTRQHTPRPPTHFWPEATTEVTSYVQQRQPLNPLNGSTPYDQRFGQAPNSTHHHTTSCTTYHQATPYDQRFGQAPNIPYTRTIGYAAHHRTTPYGLWFSHTPNITHTRTFDRVDHCQATPNETNEKTRPPDRHEFPTDYNPIPSAYISWSEVSAKDSTMHNAISDENRTHCEPDNTNTATERQEPTISDTTAKCPASRTASDDHPSGVHTSDAHLSDKHPSNEHSSDDRPNDEHTSDRHSNDDHPNDERPSDVQSTDDPTHEQIKGRPDKQQWHDATSAETYGIHKKNIATRNVGFNANKTRRDHKHANANAEKPELITTDETTKRTISHATDDAHQTSDSTYEDAAEVPPHITTCDAILDMNKTYHKPDNIDTTFEGQEFVISDTIAKCPASHTASDDHSNSAHTSDARPSGAHASDVHPSDERSTNNPAHKRTKGRTDGQLLHDAADAETRDVPKK
ncbi:hypothetical protein EV182_004548, partial [Spiromyces aspiralis]